VRQIRGRTYADRLASYRAGEAAKKERLQAREEARKQRALMARAAAERSPDGTAARVSRRERRSFEQRRREELDAYLLDRASDREWERKFRRLRADEPEPRSPVGSSWPAFEAAIRKWGPPNTVRKIWSY
jgi:hypothetical protein